MKYYLATTPRGWAIEDSTGKLAAGPFPQYEIAVAWLEHASESSAAAAAALRSELLSDDAIADALAVAVNVGDVEAARRRLAERCKRFGVQFNPKASPIRGRPAQDTSREADIAFEYYWRLRKHKRKRGNPTRIVAELAKLYGCTADHVRKVRQEYAAVEGYDKKLLAQLRAQALQRRSRKPVSKPLPPRASKLELAKQWLRDLLTTHTQMLGETVFRRARIAGFSHRTVERAAQALGIKKVGRGRGSTWTLPPKKSAKRLI